MFWLWLSFARGEPADHAVRVIDPYVRLSVSRTSAAYLVLENTDTVEHSLVGASTGVAKTVEIHTMEPGPRGVMQMRPVPRLSIAPGQSISLAPGGNHLMLIDLLGPLKEGTVPIVLRFEDGASITVDAPVRRP